MKNTRKILLALLVVFTLLMSFAVISTSAETASNVRITGSFNDWGEEPNTELVDGLYVYKVNLEKDKEYELKVFNGAWLGNTNGYIVDTTITSEYNAGWDFKVNEDNCKMKATTGGTYIFQWNSSTQKLNVFPHNENDHDYDVVTTPATCLVDGSKVSTCKVAGCGHSVTETLKAPGHNCILDICFTCYLPQPSLEVGDNTMVVADTEAAIDSAFGMVYIENAGVYQVTDASGGTVCIFYDSIYAEGSDFTIVDGVNGPSWSKFTLVPRELQPGYYYVGVYGAGEHTVTISLHTEHTYVAGKCACGAEDDNYQPPAHKNELNVGDNEFVITESVLTGLYETFDIVVEDDANYTFTASAGSNFTFFVYTDVLTENWALTDPYVTNLGTTNNFVTVNLKAGTYRVAVNYYWGQTVAGTYNVTVTVGDYEEPTEPDVPNDSEDPTEPETPAHTNALVVGENRFVITSDIIANYIEYIPFVAAADGKYTFTASEGSNFVFFAYTDVLTEDWAYTDPSVTNYNTTNNYVTVNLKAGVYCVGVNYFYGGTTVGEYSVTVTVGEYEEPTAPEIPDAIKIVLGENTVVIDGTMTNAANQPIAWLEFVVTEAGAYKFSSTELNCYICADRSFNNVLCGWTGAANLEVGTYYVAVGNSGITGEFTVKAEVVGELPAVNTIVVGENTYVLNAPLQAIGFEWMYLTVEKAGTYKFSGLSPLTFFIWPNCPNQAVVENPDDYVWNVDNVTYDLLDGFTVELEAATYLIGVRFDGDTEAVAVGEYKYSITAVEPQPEEPEVELNLFQKIIKAVTDFFAQLVAWFENLFAGLKK